MAPVMYLGRHAVLRPGDFIILNLPPKDLPEGWGRVHQVYDGHDIAYKHVTADESYQSLGLHRSSYAHAFRGVVGMADVPAIGVTSIDRFAGNLWMEAAPDSDTTREPTDA